MKKVYPYDCEGAVCKTCMFNESCATKVENDREKGIVIPIPKNLVEWMEA